MQLISIVIWYVVSVFTAVVVLVELNLAVCGECGFMSTSFPVGKVLEHQLHFNRVKVVLK